MTKKSKKALEKRGIAPKDQAPKAISSVEATNLLMKTATDKGIEGVLVVVVDAAGTVHANVRARNHGELLLLEKLAKREVNRVFEVTAFAPQAPAPEVKQ